MTFGENIDWGASYEDSHKIFDAFIDAGGNFIDTAQEVINPKWVEYSNPPTGITAMCGKLRQSDIQEIRLNLLENLLA